jgi:uncharacterized protein (TIGR03083 family)
MENSRFLECLEADYRRIRDVVPGHLGAEVPTCPEWSVADLTRHVGQVYLHKVECMREGTLRETDWPPAGLKDEEPVVLLDRAYAELVAELTTRSPSDPGGTWYEPDPTVGFWFRRMAQESVIHRIDAELAAGVPVAPIPDDLAIDGIDELLKVFVAYAFSQWPEAFTEALKNSPGHTYLIRTDATTHTPSVSWRVKTATAPDRLTVEGGPNQKPDTAVPDVTISGSPAEVLRWVWNREPPGEGSGDGALARIEGNIEALTEFRQCVVEATQ